MALGRHGIDRVAARVVVQRRLEQPVGVDDLPRHTGCDESAAFQNGDRTSSPGGLHGAVAAEGLTG